MAATYDPMFDISGKVVVITGALGGIGGPLCRGFVERGARVVGVDLADAGAAPDGVTYHQTDIAERRQVAELAAFIAEEFGQVDVLINNAGLERFGKAEDYDAEDWDRVIAVNLSGTFACCQAFGRMMIARKQGKIINIASACGVFGYPFVVAYNASKAGIWSLTQTLAVEWGLHNIQVNAVVPGFVVTPLNQSTLDDPERLELNLRIIPSGRLSEPNDLLGPIVFLASPAADYVSGELLVVDAGTVAGGGIGPPLRDDELRKMLAGS